MRTRTSTSYVPAIDGLRAVAILLVVLYHAGLAFGGGYVGVDVFFVISGYLITSIIVRDFEEGSFSTTNFWKRRVARILPVMTLVTVVTGLLGVLLLLPGQLASLGKVIMGQAGMGANFVLWRSGDYFNEAHVNEPMLHAWSLAVEEQFYLFYPLVFLLLYRYLKGAGREWKKAVATVVVLGCVIGGLATCAFVAYRENSQSAFYLMPFRAWELLVGAVIVFLPPALLPQRSWTRNLCLLLGLGAIFWAALTYVSGTVFPGFAAIPPCVGAALVIAAVLPRHEAREGVERKPFLERLLASRPLVMIGLISYSFYLWHAPLLAYAKDYFFPLEIAPWGRALLLLGIAGVSYLTWRYFEQPLRRKGMAATPATVFTLGGGSALALLMLGGTFTFSGGFPGRLPADAVKYTDLMGAPSVVGTAGLEDIQTGRVALIGAEGGQPPSVLVWGDSHAAGVATALDIVLRRHQLSGACISNPRTPPLLETVGSLQFGLGRESPEAARAVLDYIKREQIPEVILAANWPYYEEGLVRGELEESFVKTVAELEKLGCRVTVVLSPVVQKASVTKFMTVQLLRGREKEEFPYITDEIPAEQGLMRLRAQTPQVRWIDLSAHFWNENLQRYDIEREGTLIYGDKDHMTVEALEIFVAPILETTLRPVLEHLKREEAPRHSPTARRQ